MLSTEREHAENLLGVGDVGYGLEEAALAQDTLPELDADYAEYEENEEAEEEDVAQHRQSVQEQHHQDPHT